MVRAGLLDPPEWARHGLTGRGAALCLVDSGVDLAHADLRDPEGRTRVAWLLDRTAPPRGEHPALEAVGGGAVWDGASLDRARADGAPVPRDGHGHGTALASVALGDGAIDAGPGAYAGLAPEARLLVVRAYRPEERGFLDDDVVAGVRACRAFVEADATLDPARWVVLLGLGSHDGPHDGSSAFERALVDAAAGAPIVVAAGNDGERSVRAVGRALRGAPAEVVIEVPRPAIEDPTVALTVRWAPLERGSVVLLDGDRRIALDGPPQPADGVRWAATERPDLHRLILGPPLAPGPRRLRFAGEGTFDVWLADEDLGPSFFRASLGGPFVRRDGQVTVPATAPEAIAVGAAVSRPTVAGLPALEGMVGAPSPSSARGPTAAGLPKPDLIAPGAYVVAARASDLGSGGGATLDGPAWPEDPTRIVTRGTSVAAAVVAGALLLALEARPGTGAEAAALLRAAAGGEPGSGAPAAWAPDRGFGALDLDRFLRLWRDAPASAARPGAFAFGLTRPLRPTEGGVLWARVLDGTGAPAAVHLGVRGPSGDRARWLPFGVGWIPLEPAEGPWVALEVAAGERTLGTLVAPVDVDYGGAWRPAGATCAAGRSATPLSPLALIVPAAALTLARRRRARPCRGSAGRTARRRPARRRPGRRRRGS